MFIRTRYSGSSAIFTADQLTRHFVLQNALSTLTALIIHYAGSAAPSPTMTT
jgi:hypothetical protein